jgi:hypothetical protein
MLNSSLRRRTKFIVAGLAMLVAACASAQTVRLSDGTAYRLKFDQPLRRGPLPRHANGLRMSADLSGLPYFTAFYDSFGTKLAMNIIGTDPSLGGATTRIPTAIIPVEIVFDDGTDLDASNEVDQVVSSPLFQNAKFASGDTLIGDTQYGDAIQRAQFWSVGGADPNYHVLLDLPTVLPVQTIHVPAARGSAVLTVTGAPVGFVDANFLSPIIDGLALSMGFGPNTVPIFVTHNILAYQGDRSNCCTLGYHYSTSGPIATAQTWIYATYMDAGVLTTDTFADITALSHEIAEWLNDPFVGAFPGINLIPAVSFQGGCLTNFETGDPLEDLADPSFVVNGYHLQDEAYLSWFLHTHPSPAANGFYSFAGNFRSPSALCGPG